MEEKQLYAIMKVKKSGKKYSASIDLKESLEGVVSNLRIYASDSLNELTESELQSLVGNTLGSSLIKGNMPSGYYEFMSEITKETVGLNVVNDKEQIEKLIPFSIDHIKKIENDIENSIKFISNCYRVSKGNGKENIIFKVSNKENTDTNSNTVYYAVIDPYSSVIKLSESELGKTFTLRETYSIWVKDENKKDRLVAKWQDLDGIEDNLSSYYTNKLDDIKRQLIQNKPGKYSIKRNKETSKYFKSNKKFGTIDEIIIIHHDNAKLKQEIANLNPVYTYKQICDFHHVGFVVTSVAKDSNKKIVKTLTYDELIELLNKCGYSKSALNKLDKEVDDICDYDIFEYSKEIDLPNHFSYFSIQFYCAVVDECINKVDNAVLVYCDGIEVIKPNENGTIDSMSEFENSGIVIYKIKE